MVLTDFDHDGSDYAATPQHSALVASMKSFHPGHDATPGDFTRFDLNHDGVVSPADCPFPPGSPDAQDWWDNVMVPYTKASITTPMRAKYGSQVTGAFPTRSMSGEIAMKPLVYGDVGTGQGDFEFMVQKLVIRNGLSEQTAARIVTKYVERTGGA